MSAELIHNHTLGATNTSDAPTAPIYESYVGFTYNGEHSSSFGIKRTSDGSRFNENLLPTTQDKIVQVPGGDGTYYFGSYYTQRPFNISFAFDSMTEEQLASFKRWIGDKGIHDLIFDETPYKAYSAKVTGSATIKYIPFDEGDTNRIYKGEGSIQFTCFYPFARCVSVDQSYYVNYGNVEEWWTASRIGEDGNFGDIDTPFKIEISGTNKIEINGQTISWKLPTGITAILNTKTGLATDTDGKIYNQYLTGVTTLKIPAGAKADEIPTGAIYERYYI